MEGAGERAAGAATLGDARAAMAAGVVERADLTVGGAREEDRAFQDVAYEIAAGLRQVGRQRDEQRPPEEELFDLDARLRRVRVVLRRDPERVRAQVPRAGFLHGPVALD